MITDFAKNPNIEIFSLGRRLQTASSLHFTELETLKSRYPTASRFMAHTVKTELAGFRAIVEEETARITAGAQPQVGFLARLRTKVDGLVEAGKDGPFLQVF